MSEKKVQVVETKAAKVDRKTLAESIEAAFKKNTLVDVVVDTNLEEPTGMSYDDYKFIHFYRKGTTRDMFQLYINGKTGEFFVRKQAAELLGKDIEQKPAYKKIKGEKKIIHIIVKAPIDTVPAVAEKIIEACVENDRMVEKIKAEKKAQKKEAKSKEKVSKKEAAKVTTTPSKTTPVKKTEAKEKSQKKVSNK